MFSSDLHVKLLMSLLRILFALNVVNLILDTVEDSVNTILIIMVFQMNILSYLTGNKFQHHTRFVSMHYAEKTRLCDIAIQFA